MKVVNRRKGMVKAGKHTEMNQNGEWGKVARKVRVLSMGIESFFFGSVGHPPVFSVT